MQVKSYKVQNYHSNHCQLYCIILHNNLIVDLFHFFSMTVNYLTTAAQQWLNTGCMTRIDNICHIYPTLQD